MGSFTNGLLVGLGISLLIAPRSGKETRRMLAEGLRGLGSTNESGRSSRQQSAEHLQTAQEVVARATQQGMTVPEYAQQTASNEASGNTELSQPAQQAPANVPPRQGSTGATRPPRSTRPNRRP